MAVERHNIQWISQVMIILFSVFVLCNALVCLLPTFRTSDFYSAFQQSFLSRNYIDFAILNSAENSIFDRTIEEKSNKFIQNRKYFFYYIVFYINISLLSTAMLILCQFLFLASRVNKYIPIIALPIGGHDPPSSL